MAVSKHLPLTSLFYDYKYASVCSILVINYNAYTHVLLYYVCYTIAVVN